MFYVCIAHCMRKSTKCQNVKILVSLCGALYILHAHLSIPIPVSVLCAHLTHVLEQSPGRCEISACTPDYQSPGRCVKSCPTFSTPSLFTHPENAHTWTPSHNTQHTHTQHTRTRMRTHTTVSILCVCGCVSERKVLDRVNIF